MSGKRRLIVAALVSPATGVLALLISISLELIVLRFQRIPTQGIYDTGITEWWPILLPPYILFCWAVILPTVYHTRKASMKVFRNSFSLSFIMAAITCFFAFLAVSEPFIASWYMTLFGLGSFYGITVFASSLSASIIIRGQQGSAGQPEKRRESIESPD